jgi:hypothetical protein
MADLLPLVRHLILCENIPIDAAHPKQVSLINLIGRIRLPPHLAFPHRPPEFCVYVQLTECRGVGNVRIEIEEAETQTVIFQTASRRYSFGNDPLKRFGMVFRVRDSVFPSAGLYWVRLCYNDIAIFQESLLLG